MGKNAKENALDAKLIAVYDQYGIDQFLQVCARMLDIKDPRDWEKKRKVNGEVCEVMVDVMTQHYLRVNGLCGRTFHSMVLKDIKNRDSDFRTELDFTLLTPCFCVTGECKSFAGDVVATGDCLLTRGDIKADVAKQSMLHARHLKRYLEQFSLPNTGVAQVPYGVFCFVFSNGVMHDKRSTKARQVIPIHTVHSLYRYYDQLFSKFTKEVFDYGRATQVFQQAAESELLHRQHKKFVGY